MDASEVLSTITGYVVMGTALVGALVLGRWSLKAMNLLRAGYDGSGSGYGPYGSSDRSFDSYFGSGGDSVGRGMFHEDHVATHKSVERHLRKNR